MPGSRVTRPGTATARQWPLRTSWWPVMPMVRAKQGNGGQDLPQLGDPSCIRNRARRNGRNGHANDQRHNAPATRAASNPAFGAASVTRERACELRRLFRHPEPMDA